jgi:hypothetical protein
MTILISWSDDDHDLVSARSKEVFGEGTGHEECPVCGGDHERVSTDRCPAQHRVRSRLVTFGREPSPLAHVVEDLFEGTLEGLFVDKSRRRRIK